MFSIGSRLIATSVTGRMRPLHAGTVTDPIGQSLHRRVENLRRRAMLPA
jgi:hypothetical protein